jgi:putative oxidoreductase
MAGGGRLPSEHMRTALDKGSDAADSYAPGGRAHYTMTFLSDFVLGLSSRFPMARWSPIPLRLIVGYGFMQHGFAKLSRGPDAFVAILQAMGVPDPHLMAWLTILTELLGGLAVLLGAFVTVVSVPMMAVLLVAMFKVHLPYGFSSIKLLAVTAAGAQFGPVGYEVILLYVACLAALVIGGSGPFAIDGFIGYRLDAHDARRGITGKPLM